MQTANAHPLAADARMPIIRQSAPQRRVFEVEINVGAKKEAINVLSFTSCDAIVTAIEIYFDGEDPMPIEGMMIRVRPLPVWKCAA